MIEFFLLQGQVPLGRMWHLPLRSPLGGGTCGVGYMLGDPPLVVVLGVTLVDGMEALWVAPSDLLGGQCRAAAGVAVYFHRYSLGVG